RWGRRYLSLKDCPIEAPQVLFQPEMADSSMTVPPIRAVLVSVGDSPAPVLFTIRKHHPARVWYFCSSGSRNIVDQIHAQLDWHPDRNIIEPGRFNKAIRFPRLTASDRSSNLVIYGNYRDGVQGEVPRVARPGPPDRRGVGHLEA